MTQYQDYMRDLQRVIAGEKPLVIIERRKSAKAYLAAMPAAIKHGLVTQQTRLADSTGNRQPAIMVARESRAILAVLKLLRSRDDHSRADFQIAMGLALGYDRESCEEYTRSRLSRTCGCELCGGQTRESVLDDQARKARTLNLWGAS